MTKSLRLQNYRKLHSSQNTYIFDLTKLNDYPLRLLYIENNEKNKKVLFYQDLALNEFFTNNKTNSVKYVLIGDANRTNLCSEYIVETVSELYNAIQKYIASSLRKRNDPLEYYFIAFTKIYDLREYKRLLGKHLPKLINS